MSHAIYDLHCHSSLSDGILSPEALVSRAKDKNVSVLALTDHDTTQGLARARAQADIEGLELINGIEFSAQWRNRNVHIVGLNIDVTNSQLQDCIAQQSSLRIQRAKLIAEKLQGLGIPGAYEGALEYASEASIGRPHFASYLVAKGYCKSIQHAFKRYLGTGKVGDIKQVWPDMETIVDYIRNAGGVAVIAHPDKYNMTRTKLCAMVHDFKQSGGGAIEVVSGKQADTVTRDIALIAKKYGLLASCGSDFHAPGQQWQELGCFPEMPVDLDPVWRDWQG